MLATATDAIHTDTVTYQKQDILDAFEMKSMRPDVVESIAVLCRNFNLSPSDLFYKWDAFTANNIVTAADNEHSKLEESPTIEQLQQLRLILHKDQQKQLAKALNFSSSHPQSSFGHASGSQSHIQSQPSQSSFNSKSLHALLQSGTSGLPFKKITPVQATTTASQPKTPNSKKDSFASNRNGSFDLLSSPPFGQSAFSPPVHNHPKVISSSQLQSPAIKFSDRLDRAKTVDAFNKHIQFIPVPASEPVQCELSLVPGQQTDGYRYMYEKLTEKGELLDAQIEYFAKIIANQYQQEYMAINSETSVNTTMQSADVPHSDPMDLICNPAQPRNEPGLVVGRICSDSFQDGVALNAHSVMLECSRNNGSGLRIKVDLSKILDSSQPCTLFPGQIVGFVATNPSGQQLHVSYIIYPTLPPRPTTNLSEIKSMYRAENGLNKRTIHIVVASGPFTLVDSLTYEPLEALVVDVIEKDAPDVVILMGPFVDIDHPLIVSGNVMEDVDDIFREQVAKRIDRMRDARPGLQVILVPSIRDACTEWVAFPQPPLASGITTEIAQLRKKNLGLTTDSQRGLYLFPNPVQFRLNEIVFAVSTSDIVFDLAESQYMCRSGPKTHLKSFGNDSSAGHVLDRLSTCFNHVLRHRSFYPMFPSSSNACLDSTRALAMTSPMTPKRNEDSDPDQDQDGEYAGPLILQVIPDILIVSSRLQYMARNVQDCLCINPGMMTKGRNGGTYARLCIHPFNTDVMDTGDMDEDIELEHAIVHRTAVNIRRI
ncbi:hypothetical protein BDV3_007165 [Batrachochytrium dendrobatidis]